MGEMVEDILDGIYCEECQDYIGNPCGYPRKCNSCKPHRLETKKKKRKVDALASKHSKESI